MIFKVANKEVVSFYLNYFGCTQQFTSTFLSLWLYNPTELTSQETVSPADRYNPLPYHLRVMLRPLGWCGELYN